MSGARCFGRWTSSRLLGEGGFSRVWAVHDPLTGEEAALKHLTVSPSGRHHPRIDREVASLRRLAIPGVVRLIESFETDSGWCIVMERVDGEPFPGPGVSQVARWEAVCGPAVGLLRILARVHAGGLLHRDLKPDNVLVRANGQVTLLDFGLARNTDGGDTITQAGWVVGTRGYMSPQRLGGLPAGPGDDLFAVGVMIYEALCGERPWGLGVAPAPGTQAAPRLLDVSDDVAQVVAELLALDTPSRLTDAALAADRLEATGARSHTLPFLGQQQAMQTALEAIQSGRTVRIGASPGMGRRRFLAELDRRLRASNRQIARVPAGGRPLQSARALLREHSLLVEGPPGQPTLVAMLQQSRAALRKASDTGFVWLVDDGRPPDRRSAQLLEGLTQVVLVEPGDDDDACLMPLEHADLAGLFVGPERVMHLPSDAATALLARTRGIPARVAAEVRAWRDAGWLESVDGRFAIGRARLDRLLEGPAISLAVPPRVELTTDIEGLGRELLEWLERSPGPLSLVTLTRLTAQPAVEIELWMADLVDRRMVATTDEGSWRLVAPLGLAFDQDAAGTAEAHRQLAAELSPGTPGRLHHLLLAGDNALAVEEAMVWAAALERHGRSGTGLAVLHDAAALADGEPRRRLVVLAAHLALTCQDTRPLAATAELARRLKQQDIERLLRAWSGFLGGDARELNLPGFVEPELDDWRIGLPIQAAARKGGAALRQALEAAARTAPRGPRTAAREATWQAQLAYMEGRFADAARGHALAATRWVSAERIALSLLNTASAWLDAGNYDAADARAQEALDCLTELRAPYHEARGLQLQRSVAWRRGKAVSPDPGLVDAVAAVGRSVLTGLVALNEAAVARAARQPLVGRGLATRAHKAFVAAKLDAASLLARALAVHLGAPELDGERWLLDYRSEGAPPGVRMQVLALLATEGGPLEPWRSMALEVMADWSEAERARRREVLSGVEVEGWTEDRT